MNNTTRKKLVLNRETVRTLQDDSLRTVAGGRVDVTQNSDCVCQTSYCHSHMPTYCQEPSHLIACG